MLTGTASPLLPELCASAFLRRGGCLILQNIFAEALASLCDEAVQMQPRATRTVWHESRNEDWRGGEPARAYSAVSGGSVQSSIFADPHFAEMLSDVCELKLTLSGAGSYSYYHQPGDFLALHRDVRQCDVAVLTCLSDTAAKSPARSGLRIYPRYSLEPLSVLRALPTADSVDVFLEPGQTAVLLGGVVPHEVRPMAASQQRTMSVMCFRLSL